MHISVTPRISIQMRSFFGGSITGSRIPDHSVGSRAFGTLRLVRMNGVTLQTGPLQRTILSIFIAVEMRIREKVMELSLRLVPAKMNLAMFLFTTLKCQLWRQVVRNL